MSLPESTRTRLNQMIAMAVTTGLAAGVICLIGWIADGTQFHRSYLIGILFWTGLSLGALGVLMLHYLVDGNWGHAVVRYLEASARLLPPLGLLALPLGFGLQEIYVWADPVRVLGDPLLQHKLPYLNPGSFVLRYAAYFVIWSTLAFAVGYRRGPGLNQVDPGGKEGRGALCAIGLVVFVVTGTFAAIDWLMSLEPHWFSTIYGCMILMGMVLAGFAFVVAAACRMSRHLEGIPVIPAAALNDLGSLLFAFVMIWAYLTFSQFLLIWSANIVEETTWYFARLDGGWQTFGILLAVFHFAVPFVLLLSRELKRSARRLGSVASVLVTMHLVELIWLVVPAFHAGHLRIHWLDLMAPLAVGGLWFAGFLWQLSSRPPTKLEGVPA